MKLNPSDKITACSANILSANVKRNKGETEDVLEEAKNKFHSSVSNGISVLVQRHGYSRDRASTLILNQIRQQEPFPCEDEVFQVMQALGLGLDAATRAIIVSNALKSIQEKNKLNQVDAVNVMSSSLTSAKLLSVVKNLNENAFLSREVTNLELSSASKSLQHKNFESIKNSSSSTTSLSNIDPTSEAKKNITCISKSKHDSNGNPSSKINNKRKNHDIYLIKSSSSNSQSMSRNNSNLNPSTTNTKSEVNVKKMLKQHHHGTEQNISSKVQIKASSPNATRGKRVGSHRADDLDTQVTAPQPVTKRRRLDSI